MTHGISDYNHNSIIGQTKTLPVQNFLITNDLTLHKFYERRISFFKKKISVLLCSVRAIL